ncbi:glycosyltransferase [Demetria terragena]|uniref:glycosyltransferase n=1 Tax=Demetria terragena TaxID=63959 RepID=UPI000366241B|nr:glycosyltransferase [Demetria terragena]
MDVLRVYHSAVVDEWRERERTLRRRGHTVTTVTACEWVEGGIRASARPGPGEDVRSVRTYFGQHPALFCVDPRPLWRLLGQSWDVLDIHEEPYALVTAEILLIRALRRSRVPYILYSAQNIDKRYPWPFRTLERCALRHAAAVQTCNSDAARIVRRKGYPGRVDVLPLGTDLEHYRPAAGDENDFWTVGFVGRLEPTKGLDILLHALADIPDVHLIVVGDGSSKGRLHALADELGLTDRITWRGSVPAAQVQEIYREFDALVVPSLDTPRWREQFGRVAVEAMASGVPVIASRAGALAEVIGDAGLLVPQRDSVALAQAVAHLRSPGVASTLVASGLARAQRFSWGAVVDQLESIYARTNPAITKGERELLIVVVAYGDPGHLRRCLTALGEASGRGRIRLSLIDNGSDPRVRALAEQANAAYHDPGRNLGYAAAVNIGLRQADGADVLLVNPDALVTAADVARLRDSLHAHPRAAACAPAQSDPAGRGVRVGWPWPTPLTSWMDALGIGRLRRARYVSGAVLLLRAEALEQVGDFDERFFLYAEEADWQRRATRMGWSIHLVPEVTVTHVGAASSADTTRRDTHFDAAQERYLRTHTGTVGWHAARAAILVGAAGRWAVSPARRPTMRRRMIAYWQGPIRREQALGVETR